VIDEDGTQLGVLPTRDALELARSRGVDLVEVAPNAVPPVCRMMDYGKFRYEQSRRERDSRKNQHIVELKEIRIQPKIGDHDLETKARQAAKFLDAGDKVKFTVRFRGREMAHPDIGKGLLDELWEMLKTQCTVELPPRMEGRTMIMHLAPLKAKQSMAERESERTGRSAEGSAETEDTEDTAMAEALRAATERDEESRGEAETEDAQGRGTPVQGDRDGPDHADEAQQESQPAEEVHADQAPVRPDAPA
jgi:translation initiation factor IF-3